MLSLYYWFTGLFDVKKAEPRHVALGCALGAFLCCVPYGSGLVVAVVFLIGMTRASWGAPFVMTALMRPLSVMTLDPTAVELGRKIAESDVVTKNAWFFGLPGIALLGLERYHVLGGAILGVVAAIPAAIVGYRFQWAIRLGSAKAKEKLAAIKARRAAARAAAAGGAAVATGAAPAGTDEAPTAAELEEAAKANDEPEAGAPPAAKSGAFGTIWRIAPKKWIVFGVALVLFDVFAAKPLVRTVLQKQFPSVLAKAMGVVGPDGQVAQMGAVTWDDQDFEASILRGHMHFTNLQIASPKDPKKNLFQAKGVTLSIERFPLLKRQFVVSLMALDTPLLSVSRDQDGTLSVEPRSTTPEPTPAAQTDWAGRARWAMEQGKKQMEERKKAEAERKKLEAEGKVPEAEKPKRPQTVEEALVRLRSGIPGQNDALASPPRWTIRQIKLQGFQIQCQDPKDQIPSFAFKDGIVLEATEDRRANGKNTTLDLAGALVDAGQREQGQVKISFDQDPPAAEGDAPTGWKLKVELIDVDLRETDGLFATAVPLRFEKGKAKITLEATGKGLDGELAAAPKLVLTGIDARARRPGEPILGMDATRVAQEVTNCGSFELADVKITGSVLSPKVDMGDTLKNIVVQGGLNYGKKMATDAIGKGVDKLGEKLGDKIPGGAKDKADDIKKGAGGLLDKGLGGLGFGGGDKK